MKRLLVAILFILISVTSLFAETQAFFAYGYKVGLRSRDRHIYVFVDYEEQTMVVVTDFDNDWLIREGEVYIYTCVPVGPPEKAVWQVDNLLLEIDNSRAVLYIDDVKVNMRWSDLQFARPR